MQVFVISVLFFTGLSLSADQIRKFLILTGYISIALSLMWKPAIGAVLDSILCESEITAASVSQRIQRTVTEQAVKIIRVSTIMTWKKFTFLMAEIRIFLSFPIRFLHCYLSSPVASFYLSRIIPFSQSPSIPPIRGQRTK